MNEKIEIDRVEKTESQKDEVQKKSNKVVWQCRHRNYREILPFPDSKADQKRSGGQPNMVVMARNWRIELDLEDKEQKKIHEYLLKRQSLNPEYKLLTDKTKGDKLSEEGQTLQKLMEMSMPQLMQCVTDDELTSSGLMPGRVERYELIALIMKKKKLV